VKHTDGPPTGITEPTRDGVIKAAPMSKRSDYSAPVSVPSSMRQSLRFESSIAHDRDATLAALRRLAVVCGL
jgi:hypothetical protein